MSGPVWDDARILAHLQRLADRVPVDLAVAAMAEMGGEYELLLANRDAAIAALTGEVADLRTATNMLAANVGSCNAVITDQAAQIATLQRQLFRAGHPADVYLTVGDTPYMVSQFRMGMQDVDDKLKAGSQAMRDRVGRVNRVLVTHISNFGISQTWPNEADGKPTRWASLDARLQMFLAMGAEPYVVMHGWPWWMKEIVDSSGARPCTTSDSATSGRPRADKLAQFDIYTYEIARRCVELFGVRVFIFGNELKGFQVRRDGKKGFDHEEYTALYNRWAGVMERVERDTGVTLELGGPYVAIRTHATASGETVPSTHPLYGKAYGEFRKAPIAALEYWLANATRKDFACFDMGSGNVEGGERVDTFVVQQNKWADVPKWLRSLTGLPMLITECYSKTADDNNADVQRLCAAKTVAYLSIIESGYIGAWPWGAIGQGEDSINAGLLTGYSDADAPQPFYEPYRCIGEHFSLGAQLYPVTVEGEGIYAKCAGGVVVMVNMTPEPRSVCLGETVYQLAGHRWRKVDL